MRQTIYLVFGDLHGRVLPAFKLAMAWGRYHGLRVDGILQVGDLGYFPDLSRLDKATSRYAADDPMELGAQLVAQPSPEADAVFSQPDVPQALWFTAGNHEDFDALESWSRGAGGQAHFPVDAYLRVYCIRDGAVAMLLGDCRVGALWGVAHATRKKLPPRGHISTRSAQNLAFSRLDVLLTHDGPANTEQPGSGSDEIHSIIRNAQPRFAFFGHYRGAGKRVEGDFGATEVYHLAGMELRRLGMYPEEGCVGVLQWYTSDARFDFVDNVWLMKFPRSTWLDW